MPEEFSRTNDDPDLDRTDTLPVLLDIVIDPDVADDAVPLDHRVEPPTAAVPPAPTVTQQAEVAHQAEVTHEVEDASEVVDPRVVEAARGREALQHAEEVRALRDALITRDAKILDMLQTLDQRDGELGALQREQAQYRSAAAAAGTHGESKLDARRAELRDLRARVASYAELLQAREWRRMFHMNMFLGREDDAPAPPRTPFVGDVPAAADLPAASHAIEYEKTEPRSGGPASQRASAETAALAIAALDAQVAALRAAAAQLRADLAERDGRLAAQTAQIAQLQTAAAAADEEMTVLIAHLREARRPLQAHDAQLRRLTDELAASTARLQALAAENRDLQAAQQALRAAAAAPSSESAAAGIESTADYSVGPAEYAAEMIRIDGAAEVTYVLGRRVRIGRAGGCEMHIDSPTVSRHHALVLIGPRGCIIEDLHSTNGLYVNGRKIIRQLLRDGDAVTIGEARFRFTVKPTGPAPP